MTKKDENMYRETMNKETIEEIIERIKNNHEYSEIRFKEIVKEINEQQQEYLEILNKIEEIGTDEIDKNQLIDFELKVRKNYDELIKMYRKQGTLTSEYSVLRITI